MFAVPVRSPVFIPRARRPIALYVRRCSLFLRHERGRPGASFPPQSILRSLFSAPGAELSRDSPEAGARSPRGVGAVGGAGLHPCVARVWDLPNPPPAFC